jgi:hypothetical protein
MSKPNGFFQCCVEGSDTAEAFGPHHRTVSEGIQYLIDAKAPRPLAGDEYLSVCYYEPGPDGLPYWKRQAWPPEQRVTLHVHTQHGWGGGMYGPQYTVTLKGKKGPRHYDYNSKELAVGAMLLELLKTGPVTVVGVEYETVPHEFKCRHCGTWNAFGNLECHNCHEDIDESEAGVETR